MTAGPPDNRNARLRDLFNAVLRAGNRALRDPGAKPVYRAAIAAYEAELARWLGGTPRAVTHARLPETP